VLKFIVIIVLSGFFINKRKFGPIPGVVLGTFLIN
jgi:hypothetical protein